MSLVSHINRLIVKEITVTARYSAMAALSLSLSLYIYIYISKKSCQFTVVVVLLIAYCCCVRKTTITRKDEYKHL